MARLATPPKRQEEGTTVRRLLKLGAVLACIAALAFTNVTPAIAADDWGTTWGFTYFPITTQDHCGGGDPQSPLVFQFEAYWSGPAKVTAEWQVQHHGTMAIRAWSTTGPITAVHYFDSDTLPGTKVYFWRIPNIPNASSIHYTWSPTTGGNCYDTTTIR
jgi:hypothetical protein